MPSFIVVTIILGIVVCLMTFFLVRSYLTPRKIASIAALVKDGRTKSAIHVTKQLLAKDSRNCDLHYLLGLSYLKENRPELTLMEFRTVNQLASFSEICPEREYRRTAGELYEQFGYPEEALKEHLMLIKLEPSEASHYFHAGLLFEKRGQDDVAINYFRKALELDGTHTGAHFRLGVLLTRNNSPVEAKVELEATVKLQSDNFPAWFYLGRLMKADRDYVGALSAFEKAQRDQEIKVKALVERGGCYLQMNNLDKATIDLERAVRLSEGSENRDTLFARYYLAACHEKSRRLDEAVEQWEKIYTKNPGFRDVGAKLSQYQALRADDRIKDYLTVNEEGFQEICRSVVGALGLRAREVEPFPNGCQVIALENGSGNRITSAHPKLIRFLRAGEDIPESTARRMYDDMKKLSVHRSMIIASSSFSRQAIEFAETRPIELIGRERLQQLLSRAEQ